MTELGLGREQELERTTPTTEAAATPPSKGGELKRANRQPKRQPFPAFFATFE